MVLVSILLVVFDRNRSERAAFFWLSFKPTTWKNAAPEWEYSLGRPVGSRNYSRLHLQRQFLEKIKDLTSILRSEAAHQSTESISKFGFRVF